MDKEKAEGIEKKLNEQKKDSKKENSHYLNSMNK